MSIMRSAYDAAAGVAAETMMPDGDTTMPGEPGVGGVPGVAGVLGEEGGVAGAGDTSVTA